jgi:ELWxxDGT repeat protein
MTGIAREYYRAKSYYHTNLIAYQVQLDRLDRSKGVKLWLSDGTRDHTFVLDDKINYNYGGTKTIEKDSKVYFVNNGRLIESDGTPNGTHKYSYGNKRLSSCSFIQGDKIYVNDGGEPLVLSLSNLSEEPQSIKDTQGNRVYGTLRLVGSKIYYLGSQGVWYQADANATPKKLNNDQMFSSFRRRDALIGKYLIYTAKVDTDDDGEIDTYASVSLDTSKDNQRILLHDKDNHNLQFLQGSNIFGNKLFFRNSDTNNKGVWVTDGTQEGTIKLLEISGSVYFFMKNDHIIISDYQNYWVTDGTKEGTKPIQKANPNLDYGVNVNGYWVHMTESQADRHHELWSENLDNNTTDALIADPIGTQSMVRSTADKDRVELFGSTYYFGKNMYYDIGSQSIKRFHQIQYGMRRMTQVGKKIYFLDAEPYSWNKFSLCRINIDGTDFEKLDDNVLSYTLTLANVGEWVYFVRHGEDNERASLWKIKNGMAKPMRVLAQGQKKIAYPQAFRAAGKFLYFLAKEADDNMAGIELWRTDGTVAGTYMLKDILPGSRSAFLSYLDHGRYILNSAAVGDKLYFRAYDGNADKNVSIWVTNGTKSGTKKISNSSFKEAYNVSYVFFVPMAQGTYATLSDDRLLWIDNADDTLHDTLPPSADSGSTRRRHATQNIVIGDRMYFLHNDGNGTDWWYARNGVAKAVKDTNGNRPKITDEMWKKAFTFDDAVYYISDDSEKGDVLKRFKPDGNGTYQIKEVYDGAEDGPYRGLYYWKAGSFDGKLLSGFGHPAALYLIDQNLSKIKLAEDQD